ncbi:tetratricopeptide repeat protein, partial [bacterium]|nr:tetratricopeptide repeat protein [bacterium]
SLLEFRAVKRLDPDFPNIGHLLLAAEKKNEEVSGQIVAFMETAFEPEIHELANFLQINEVPQLAHEIELLLKMGKPQEALQKIRNAEAIVPDSKPLLLLSAAVYKKLGRFNEAESALIRAKNLFPDDPEILNNLGNIFLAKNHFKEAKNVYQKAIQFAPNDRRILNNLGILEMQTYQLDRACSIFERILRDHHDWPPAQRNLVKISRIQKELDVEILRLRNEFQAHPTYLDIGLALGKNLMFRGVMHESREILEGVISGNPDLIPAYFYLGTIHELLGFPEKSISSFREMVVRKKRNQTPEFKAFESFLREGYQDEALEEIKKIAVLDLDFASSHINIGKSYFEQGAWDAARRHFEKAISINMTYPDAFYWSALAKMRIGKPANAERDLKKAIELNPRFSDAHYQLGMLLRGKAPKKAKQHFQTAVSLGLRPQFAMIAEEFLANHP